jgi:hypothetical protein
MLLSKRITQFRREGCPADEQVLSTGISPACRVASYHVGALT